MILVHRVNNCNGKIDCGVARNGTATPNVVLLATAWQHQMWCCSPRHGNIKCGVARNGMATQDVVLLATA
ncbi:hypothetical protein Y032_0247g49 [Ancylostoma ceylanicum]|uniref:Uncharacterized protein n=1 Tax=Ancylostoma ceylanicum TaxID=53326 RepID=A0A016SDG8_9BILA|nr:hypothetical protein Y032_0247g49 [Ancylostoma ceylanicum]